MPDQKVVHQSSFIEEDCSNIRFEDQSRYVNEQSGASNAVLRVLNSHAVFSFKYTDVSFDYTIVR